MIQTNDRNSLYVETDGTVVSVNPGGARLGNVVYPFRGGKRSFSQMTNYGGDSSVYQNSLLFINPVGSSADLTSSLSVTRPTAGELVLPTMPSDSSNPYSAGHPLGLFTFYTSDGTTSDLMSFSRM